MHPECVSAIVCLRKQTSNTHNRMQIQTILNQYQKYSSFRYGKCKLVGDGEDVTLEVEIQPRKNSRPKCGTCGKKGPIYDHQPKSRRFDFVPFWGIAVVFIYTMRRVDCPVCGVKIERIPWAQGKSPITTTYGWFLSQWAKLLCWSDTAKMFRTSWSTVFNSVEMAVEWGRKHMTYEGVTAIGVDEIQWQKGHHYLSVVYQINEGARRLLWVGEKRKVKTLLKFFRWFGKEKSEKLEFVASDMWKPYLKVIARKAKNALNVLDRFHIMKTMNEAVNDVRKEEVQKLHHEAREPVLTKSRWILLKRKSNLTVWQNAKLADLLKYNLKSIRAYLLKEDFQQFWHYMSPYWAEKFLDEWCRKTMLSKIESMKKVAKSLRKHKPLILNWFRAKGEISSAAVEGLNNKSKLTIRKAYGFRSFRTAEIALYHTLGKLPEPKFTHTFW
jgi:transposase